MSSIILLHGALGSDVQFNALQRNLSSQGKKVYTFNFSGHGKKTFAKGFSIEQFSNELAEFIDENKLQGVDVFGYSMGGYVALYTVLQNPGLLNVIICLGTKFEWNPEIASKEIKNLNPELIAAKIPKFAHILQELHGESWRELLQKTGRMMHAMGEKNPIEEQDFKKITNPVCICLSEGDKMVSEKESKHIASLIPHSKFISINHGAHILETIDVLFLCELICKETK
ncbi:MAG: alpha/beta fold hydrolase [Sphingobacteriaceae bacterium]|nr:alpha/beta fold hydrolase [Sphingobacteriaceae bacterium]